MTRVYTAILQTCAVLGVLRAIAVLVAVGADPALLPRVNPWGVPYWAPGIVAVVLGVLAVLMLRREAVLWQALAAIWGAGAWAFSTPLLAEWPPGPWWSVLVGAVPLSVWPLVQEARIGVRRLGAVALAVLGLGALGSLARSPAAVAVAAFSVYTASIVGPGWLTWWAYRRS